VAWLRNVRVGTVFYSVCRKLKNVFLAFVPAEAQKGCELIEANQPCVDELGIQCQVAFGHILVLEALLPSLERTGAPGQVIIRIHISHVSKIHSRCRPCKRPASSEEC